MPLDKSTLKKIGCGSVVSASLICTILGFGISTYNNEWVTAVCVLVLAGCAVPTIVRIVKQLIP